MVKIFPIITFLFKFVSFTTQWNYDGQKSNLAFYDLEGLINELGIKSKGQGSVTHIKSKGQGSVSYTKPKSYVSRNKHSHSDERTQYFNLEALSALFKNDRSESENNKLCEAGRCSCRTGDLRCTNHGDNKDARIVYRDGVEELMNKLKGEIEKDRLHKNKKQLRCNSVNGRCTRGRTGSDNNDNILKHGSPIDELKRHGKKYKLNEDVNAIVVDISHLDKMLSNVNNNDRNDELLNQEKLHKIDKLNKGVKKFTPNADTVVNDMSKEQTDENFVKQVNILLTTESGDESSLKPEDLLTYYQLYKTFIIDKVMDYVKSKNGRKMGMQNVTEKQKRLIDNIKHKSQNSHTPLSETEVKKQIARIIFGEHSMSKVVAHNENNNNIYVPEWFYKKALKSKTVSVGRTSKRLFPLTQQQRLRKSKKITPFWRRSSGPNAENYGVPFELQVQGLGQLIP